MYLGAAAGCRRAGEIGNSPGHELSVRTEQEHLLRSPTVEATKKGGVAHLPVTE